MDEPKFNPGDEVALKDQNIAKYFHVPSFIVESYTSNVPSDKRTYLVKGTSNYPRFNFKEEKLYLYSPENRTKILLGLDLQD